MSGLMRTMNGHEHQHSRNQERQTHGITPNPSFMLVKNSTTKGKKGKFYDVVDSYRTHTTNATSIPNPALLSVPEHQEICPYLRNLKKNTLESGETSYDGKCTLTCLACSEHRPYELGKIDCLTYAYFWNPHQKPISKVPLRFNAEMFEKKY